MKRLLFVLALAGGLCTADAQGPIRPQTMEKAPWTIGLGFKAGLLNQHLASYDVSSRYADALNAHTGRLTSGNGHSIGFDLLAGYYFGKKRAFGVGTGVLYAMHTADISMNDMHIEYRSTDLNGYVFRQVISSAKPMKETVKTASWNIPLLLKYKQDLNATWGFAADAGLLFNLSAQNSWNATAAFDYEAIYRFDNNGVPVYDNSPVPDQSGWLITREHFLANNPGGDVNAYFATLKAEGYNVGLGKQTRSRSGKTSFRSGSVGFLLQPSVTYNINDRVALNGGVYLLAQSFGNDENDKKITDRAGEYNSLTNIVSKSSNVSYGVNLGLRFSFGKPKDDDRDGIRNRMDHCPDVAGLASFNGCPDADGDGIQDKEDVCPLQAGPLSLNGCPDSDNDGIADKDDACPGQAGEASLKGCADTDKDGIADKDDRCPEAPGKAQFNGCPDSDGDEVPDHMDECVNEKGSSRTSGCPDADQDDVADSKDQCPQLAGNANHHGCPDTDGDGVFDDADSCINLAGEISRSGCPEINQDTRKIFEGALQSIEFEKGKAVLKSTSYAYLRSVARAMKENPSYKLVISGHTDNTGNEDNNKKISQQRADAVAAWLVKNGIAKSRIEAIGYGSSQPAGSNDTEAGRSRNRRVELKASFL